jgi:hypothetical protein
LQFFQKTQEALHEKLFSSNGTPLKFFLEGWRHQNHSPLIAHRYVFYRRRRMHFIKSYSRRRCEAIGAKAGMLKALLCVFVSVTILPGMQTANARPVAIMMIAHPKASALSVNQVVLEEIQTGTSTESVTVTTSANLIAVSGHLYLAAISTKARLHLDGVSGLGLTWTLVKKQCAGRGSTMVEVWMALGTPSSDGPVTAHFPAAPSNAVITVLRYSGVYDVDPIGNVVSFSTNGEDGSCTGGTDTGNYSFNLTTTTNDAVVCAAAALRSKTHAPGTGYTGRAEITEGTPNAAAGIAVMDKTVASTSTVAVNGALSGATDWSVVAVEIKPETSVTTVINEHATPPADFQLGQNYPNPFSSEARSPALGGRNPGTQINFSLPASGKVILEIYSETGQLVRTLVEGEMAAGPHSVRWNGRNLLGKTAAAGIYLYRVVVRGKSGDVVFAQTRRMALLK